MASIYKSDEERGIIKLVIARPSTEAEQAAIRMLETDERLVVLVKAGLEKMRIVTQHLINASQ